MLENNLFVLFKDKNINLPDESILRKIYLSYDKSISFFALNGKNIHINLNYTDFETFSEDLYGEVKQEEGLFIAFFSKIGNYISNLQEKDFYRTENNIFISSESVDFINKMTDFDIFTHKELFNMFCNNNMCFIVNKDVVEYFGGELVKYNNFFVSENIFDDNFQIVKCNNIENMDNCYFCDPNSKILLDTYTINKGIVVCEDCFKKLKCFKCKKCGNYFSGKYEDDNNVCIECSMKLNLPVACYYVDAWQGKEYIHEFIGEINEKDSKTSIGHKLKNKSEKELKDLMIRTFNRALTNKKKFIEERKKLFDNLSRKILVKK